MFIIEKKYAYSLTIINGVFRRPWVEVTYSPQPYSSTFEKDQIDPTWCRQSSTIFKPDLKQSKLTVFVYKS